MRASQASDGSIGVVGSSVEHGLATKGHPFPSRIIIVSFFPHRPPHLSTLMAYIRRQLNGEIVVVARSGNKKISVCLRPHADAHVKPIVLILVYIFATTVTLTGNDPTTW